MKYKHIFTLKGYGVAVIYRNDTDSEGAALYVAGKWDKVRCEPVCQDGDE